MKYYSTNKQVENVSLEEAVVKGLADDKGLFMPYEIKKLPAEFFENIDKMTFQEMSF
jgi:threonine synthase